MFCPTDYLQNNTITMAHGSGGKMADSLMEQVILPIFKNNTLQKLHDGAFLHFPSANLAFTTDSFVVTPLFFPGGDIGKLASIGTINDLAMCGAKPLYMSCSLIIEEGFDIKLLHQILSSMQTAAQRACVTIVTGDTKVIERSTGGNLFINTSAIGVQEIDPPPCAERIQEGDVILLSGDIGRHGMAIMGARENLTFHPPLESDCEDLFPSISALITERIEIHAMRDVTRGGLASILLEMSQACNLQFTVEEEKIEVCDAVHCACELLGLDPLYVACEGRFVLFLPSKEAKRALALLQKTSPHLTPCVIGTVQKSRGGSGCIMKNSYGIERYLYKLSAELLPRIC